MFFLWLVIEKTNDIVFRDLEVEQMDNLELTETQASLVGLMYFLNVEKMTVYIRMKLMFKHLLMFITALFQIYNFHSLMTQTTKYNRKMGSIVGTFSLVAPILTPLVCIKMSSRYRKGVVILFGRMTRFKSESEDRGKTR